MFSFHIWFKIKTIYLLFNFGLNQNHLLVFQLWFTIKPIKYQCKTVYNIIHYYLENGFKTLTFFCLLNFEHDSTIFPPLILAYTFDVLYLIRQHHHPNTIRYLLCMIYYELYTMHYALYTIHYTLCTMYYALCIMHYLLCIMHYALCTMHYLLYNMHTYLYVFTILYIFICIHTYLVFHVEIQRNPMILVLTRSTCRVE